MDDERERQQRDLEQALLLLERMSREDMFELLHGILLNDRSDDTRKLSDWMAFQIILGETPEMRTLLQELGKDEVNHSKVEAIGVSSASLDILIAPEGKDQGQEDDIDDDSSSASSFVTCPDSESLKRDPEGEAVGVDISQTMVDTHDEQTLPSLNSNLEGPYLSSAKCTSRVQSTFSTIFQHYLQTFPEPRNSHLKAFSQPGSHLDSSC
ncbi:hypothetical protein diail_827 [Diaporthe ilicicola]|nr:hypothetical protein diail_827 [Diaporthe ilicicola]